MRRLVLATCLTSALAGAALAPARGQDDLTALRPKPGDPPAAKLLDRYLQGQAKLAFDARRKAVAALKTPADVAARQADLRPKFRAAFGELPTVKTPLNARVVGRDARDGYTVERVVYESRPNHHVTALLYLPEGKRPVPGVLVPCGHSANGKAGETYQQISILLAKNGLAALCYDPVGQGERVQLLKDDGKPATAGSTTEHTLLHGGALLVGRTAAGYRVWDGIRSLDYLASRPEVDPKRLGCTGNSGGGTLTAYLMAFDDRIEVAAPSCYMTSLERLFATIGPQDGEQNLPGQVALGIEHADYVTLRAPKPTLLSVGTQDFFDIDGSWTTFREVKKIYGILGHGERVDLFESDEPHGFTKPRRESCMRWMRRWLLAEHDAPVETLSPTVPDKMVQVTNSGQVLTDYQGVSAFDLNAKRADELAAARAKRFADRTPEQLRAEVERWMALPKLGPITVSEKKEVRRDGLLIQAFTLETEPGVLVPTLLFRKETPEASTGPTTIYVGAERSLARPGGPVEALAKAGVHVAMIDPRGTGETAPGRPGRGQAGVDDREAFLALHLNRPLLAQRVFDVMQAMRALHASDPKEDRGIHLIGVGLGGPVVLHAAAAQRPREGSHGRHSLISWSAVARSGLSRGQLSSVLPGVLEAYDLPDLALARASADGPHPARPLGRARAQGWLMKTRSRAGGRVLQADVGRRPPACRTLGFRPLSRFSDHSAGSRGGWRSSGAVPA
ncbi:MAG: acetylxylan esterase [Isosphaeraceae bacterium]